MIRTIVLSTVLLAAAAAPAEAAAPRTELRLSYQAEAGYAAAVVLRCDPAGGPHPRKGNACKALAKAGGDPARLKPAKAMCTMEYSPVTAAVRGSWRGTKIDWSRTFGNACQMRVATGIVMIF
ncbi:SSI family serine proteinase inhibitor [Actinoplanes sp. NPDC051494]|uniref:SSI family serine proteinase inhibitor n=1 Tax=Actinoplanes sp. NPDC051494 TaxID=3363907 RepID=UPI00379F715D